MIREIKLRKIGLDPGFGGIKVAEMAPSPNDEEGHLTIHVLPSVVGVGTTNAGALTLAGVVRSRGRRTTPHLVAFDGIEYLVGSGVAHYARPIERIELARFSDSPELRALIYTSLYQLLNGENEKSHRLALVMGLPVEILQDRDQAAAAERNMARWLLGRHHFTLDGRPAHLEIVKLRTKIAQPLATWFDWGLDHKGKWTRGSAAARAPALVIDQGFNTLDLLVVEGGQISNRYTGGDTLGMRRACEEAGHNIRRRYGVEMSLHETDELVQRVVSGKKALIYVAGEATEVTPQIRQALDTLTIDIIKFIERSVRKGRKFKILITGGGALALGPRLLAQYPHATVVDNPVLANARGLAKLAVRPGFLDQ